MDIKPIKTKTDYQAALKEIETLMDAKPRTPRGDRLDVLATLVQAYEARHHPLDLPDPVEADQIHDGKQRADRYRSIPAPFRRSHSLRSR